MNKPRTAFYRRSETRVYSHCKACFNAYCVQRWIGRKIKYVAVLGNRCTDCRRQFHYAVYDFHHIGAKDVGWGQLRLRSDTAICKELKKCVLLCANCHRLRHATEYETAE